MIGGNPLIDLPGPGPPPLIGYLCDLGTGACNSGTAGYLLDFSAQRLLAE